jgi:hypothetical protein
MFKFWLSLLAPSQYDVQNVVDVTRSLQYNKKIGLLLSSLLTINIPHIAMMSSARILMIRHANAATALFGYGVAIAAPGDGGGPGQGLGMPTQILELGLPGGGGSNDGVDDKDNDNYNNANALMSTSPCLMPFFPGAPLLIIVRGTLATLV